MKKLLYSLVFIAALQAPQVYGQGCRISISYDDNGNRILRELVCAAAREASEQQGQDSLAMRNAFMPFQVESNFSTFKVYPNPTNSYVHVEVATDALKGRCSFVLSDVSGKVHFRRQITASRTTLSLAHLADGVYFLTLFREDKRDVVKIVKEAGSSGF